MLFALGAFAMIGLVGVALDFSRALTVRVSVQNALDAAALSAAELQSRGGASMADLQDAAQAMLDGNITESVPHTCTTPTLTRDAVAGRVSLRLECETATTLSALLGFAKLDIAAQSTAEYARTQLDVAMMLDVTGSMTGQKLADLKDAAKLLVDTVVDPAGQNEDVRVALAPFAASINVGGYFNDATGQTAAGNTCVTERLGGQAYTDAAPGPGRWSEVGPTNCPGASILPLSHDPDALKSRIDAFTAGGHTAGHLGVAWARYLVSPQWSGVWPADSEPMPFGDPRKVKAVILMTDGYFNKQYSGLGTSAEQAREHCDAIKADGIIVYTVAFQAGGAAEALLQNCASPGNYYRATTGTALRDAYRTIGLQLRRLRISR
jgi:Flp pilus assembly protein TadG